jgi:hypothetical protein
MYWRRLSITESCRLRTWAEEPQDVAPRFASMTRSALTSAVLLFSLSACGQLPPAEEVQPGPAVKAADEATAPGEELPTSQTTPDPIPLAYRHLWAVDPADCSRQPGLTRIAIEHGAIRFHGGEAVVKKAQAEGPDKLLLDVDHTSEGEMRPERHSLALNHAGSRLLYQRGRDSLNYIRCD